MRYFRRQAMSHNPDIISPNAINLNEKEYRA